MKITTLTRKSLLTLLVGAFAFSGLIGVSGANTAVADETVPAQHINAANKGKIIIHKFANPSSGTAGLGTELSAPNAPTTDPVPNVEFTYQKVEGVDLTTNAGWKAASGLAIGADGESVTGHTLGTAATVTTNTAGVAETGELKLGVYLVRETNAPKTVVTKSAPFLVTVPYPNNDATTKEATPWLYDVNVYPKNTVLTNDERPVKAINDKANIHFPGDNISWTITQKIPKLDGAEKLKSYKFVDELPGTVNAITDTDANIVVEIKAADGQTDINATPTKSVKGQTVTVEFPEAEANKLIPGATVTITLKTTLSSAAGSVQNQSKTAINGHEFSSVPDGFDFENGGDPDDPTNDKAKTTLDMAPLKIHKENSSNQPLKGAQFVVAPAVGDSCDSVDFDTTKYGTPLETAADGNASLKVKYGKYCVKETTAPVGYVLDEQVRTVDIDSTDKTLTVTNLKYSEGDGAKIPGLPVTGASGFIIMVLGGSAVIALAVGTGFVAVGRKRRNN